MTLIRTAAPEDAEAVAAITRAAFTPVAAEYGMASLPPLEDTADGVREQIERDTVLVAVEDGIVVGSVRAALRDGTCEVGRLVVDPAYAGCGVGTALAREIEARFPDARRFELFTGHKSAVSLHIYEGLGYVPFRQERVSDTLELVFMEKLRDDADGACTSTDV